MLIGCFVGVGCGEACPSDLQIMSLRRLNATRTGAFSGLPRKRVSDECLREEWLRGPETSDSPAWY